MIIVLRVFAFIGFVAMILFSVALFLDIKAMDKTDGGYEAPYTGVTGETIDWDVMDLTATGR